MLFDVMVVVTATLGSTSGLSLAQQYLGWAIGSSGNRLIGGDIGWIQRGLTVVRAAWISCRLADFRVWGGDGGWVLLVGWWSGRA